MSTPINDGGPVYPNTIIASKEGDAIKFNVTHGMTLRDYFAGQALIGILMAPGQLGSAAQNNPDQAAHWAYGQADSMIAARIHQEDAK